ncbi:MAG: hypothetical protein N838_26595 [Thiohalocapsa sp. PB-PSB1]|jgi:beta-aspartyl-peptidase (threonine type)|nr:MAG: hypothetical protein N838_26595 [Thiohalocapsa sp. PB-PSB1]
MIPKRANRLMVGLMAALMTVGGSLVEASWTETPGCEANDRFVLLAHGGAGAGDLPLDTQQAQIAVLHQALHMGGKQLQSGATATETVARVIQMLEDSPWFNAGRGAIPNRAGFVELDASIMRGRDRNAGAVAAVRTIKNPILAARAAMEQSDHLMFVDRGAENFARTQGLELMSPEYFLVDPNSARPSDKKTGTVGAVALDRCGHLAAGTSTGGYTSKAPGRVGDSPIIGAGTWADNRSCAVSATGWGEFFIRQGAARDVAARVEYLGESPLAAARQVLASIRKAGATGGLIVLDRQGRVAWPYTSRGMLRGMVDETGDRRVGVMEEMR